MVLEAGEPPPQLSTETGTSPTLADIGEQPWELTYQRLQEHLATPTNARAHGGEYPIQLGLHGFDTIGHHRVVVGRANLLLSATVPAGDDLAALAALRLRRLAPHDPQDDPADHAKRAVEAIKAAVVLASVRRGRAPTRNCEVVPHLFEAQIPPFQRKAVWRWIWLEYRRRQRTLPQRVLEEFISDLVTTMGV